MRKILAFFIMAFSFGAAWGSSPQHHAVARKTQTKNLREGKNIVFPTRLDLSGSSYFLVPQNPLLTDKKSFPLSHKLLFEGSSVLQGDSKNFQYPGLYLSVLKAASVGIAYPLSSKLLLDGRYVIVRGKGIENIPGEVQMPLFSAVYRFNTKTSISLSYSNQGSSPAQALFPKDKQNSTAELRINF